MAPAQPLLPFSEIFRPGSTRSYISMRMTTSLFNLGDDCFGWFGRVCSSRMAWSDVCAALEWHGLPPFVSFRFLICFSGLCMALHAFSRDLLLCAALIGCTISFFLLIVVCGTSLDSVEGPSLDSVDGCFWFPLFAALSQFFSSAWFAWRSEVA